LVLRHPSDGRKLKYSLRGRTLRSVGLAITVMAAHGAPAGTWWSEPEHVSAPRHDGPVFIDEMTPSTKK
jgi:hypothetical protein